MKSSTIACIVAYATLIPAVILMAVHMDDLPYYAAVLCIAVGTAASYVEGKLGERGE